jgi:hypothetical protein
MTVAIIIIIAKSRTISSKASTTMLGSHMALYINIMKLLELEKYCTQLEMLALKSKGDKV